MTETARGQIGSITMIGEQNRAIVDRYNERAAARDLDGMAEILATDVVVEFPQSGEKFDRETFLLVHRNFPGGLPKIEPLRTTGRDDFWVVEHRLDYGQGRPYTAVTMLELRDGKAVHMRVIFGEDFDPPEWRTKLLAERK